MISSINNYFIYALIYIVVNSIGAIKIRSPIVEKNDVVAVVGASGNIGRLVAARIEKTVNVVLNREIRQY